MTIVRKHSRGSLRIVADDGNWIIRQREIKLDQRARGRRTLLPVRHKTWANNGTSQVGGVIASREITLLQGRDFVGPGSISTNYGR